MATIETDNTAAVRKTILRAFYGTTDVAQPPTSPGLPTEPAHPLQYLAAAADPVSRIIDEMHTSSSLAKKEVLREQMKVMGEPVQTLGDWDNEVAENGDLEEIRKIEDDSNSILEEVLRVEQKPRFDPIKRLPEEIWLIVLEEALTTEMHGCYSISAEMALSLTFVSLKWRKYIETTPLLWRDVVLDDKSSDLAAKTTVSLELSGAVPLTIIIVGPMHCWHGIKPVLVLHKERIRRIWVAGGDGYSTVDLFTRTVPHLSTPQLRDIYVTSSHNGEMGDQLFEKDQSPLIRSISILPLSGKILHLPATRNLLDLTTYEDVGCILGIAYDMPLLRNVEFIVPRGVPQIWAGAHDGAKKIPSISAALRWTSLVYAQPSTQSLNSLLTRLPYLVSLKMSLAYDFLPQTMVSMEHLGSLYNLDITIQSTPTKEFIPPGITRPLNVVQKLRFSDGEGTLDKNQLVRVSNVPRSFFLLMPNVHIFEIDSYLSPMVYELADAMGFQNLRTLVLDIKEEGVPPEKNSTLPSTVSTLEINGWDPHKPDGLFATAVTNLRAGNFYPEKTSSGRHRDKDWAAIQKLHVSHIDGPLDAHDARAVAGWESFSSLTTLHIDGYTHRSEADDVTEICIFIAMFPDVCPALHTLALGRFPDLDILFIMLERRNLPSNSTGARIRRLSLPIRVSPPNFKPIRDLLRGHNVERQSNYDASMHRDKEILEKMGILGCISCYKAQTICVARPKEHTGKLPRRVYPKTVDEILVTWNKHELSSKARKLGRIVSCRANGELTQISEDSEECELAKSSYHVSDEPDHE